MTDAPDIYPLSPMQRAMLFQSVAAPGADVYVEQLDAAIVGECDPATFRTAWSTLIERHAPLRTAFAWQRLAEPLQVAGNVAVPLRTLDWRYLSEAERIDRLVALRRGERETGFDPACAPLFRLVLIRWTEHSSRLVWTWHHIILDAWSVPVLLDELRTVYAALREGRVPDLPPVRPYADFIAWQRELDPSPQRDFWRARLADLPDPTPLAIGPGGRDDGYGYETRDVSPAEIERWRDAARRHGVTLSTLVQGAWALLLSRYIQQREVLFGTAVAGRPAALAGVETMVGLFVNTLPVRIKVDPDDRLSRWLAGVQQEQVAARRHEQSALADIQGWIGASSRDRPFDSLLVVEDFASHRATPDDGALRIDPIDFTERADFPLAVTLAVRDRSVLGVAFSHERFKIAAMERLLDHVRSLLDRMSAGDQRLGDLDILTAAERDKAVDDWSRGATPIAPHHRLPDVAVSRLFEAQVRCTPTATAAIMHTDAGDRAMTYAELNARANRLARRLRGLGVGTGERVAVCMTSSLARLVAVIATLKAGAAYVPLDPALPTAMLEELVADCAPRAIIAGFDTLDLVGGIERTPIVALGDEPGRSDTQDDDLPDAADPGDPAYLIYTSGSTGRRKGVVAEHRSLRHLVEGQRDAFGLEPGMRVLHFSSFGFDASVWEIFATLLSGGCLCLADRAMLTPSTEMMALLARWRVAMLTIPPSVLARLPVVELPDLTTLVVAGEACPAGLADRWAAPGRRFFNAYGPTEATVCATIGEVGCDVGKPTIGRPFGDSRVYLLDQAMRPVPVGVLGHLHIGGPGVARGYWRRPDLTAAAFVPDPFEKEEGARLYHTGDLARYDEDGRIDYLGRIDAQVKIHGIRIEPGEVEAALRARPDVNEAAVLVTGDGDEGRLIAFVAGSFDALGFDEAALREALRACLPAYMVPKRIAPVPTLPLSASGKVDRRALLALVPRADPPRATGMTTGDDVERLVARIWCGLLGVEAIDTAASFFDQGGHSLLLLAMQERLREEAGVAVPVTDLFRHPTVASLARHLRALEAQPAPPLAIATQRADARRRARTARRGSVAAA